MMDEMPVPVSMTLGTAVPVAVDLVSRSVRVEFIVLGAIIGLAYWYWRPLGLPF
ncbi:hypothetical protein [Rhizobium sp. RU36D]|uniref:hypothetical protein n=1 Tax=Rhizobium sp. RU36D TaxID=1907415 RepID=UPI0009D83B94|nr:hypothetical protein [Rhizobium sp. RU36D]SMC42565.1 hypothetical protein SAMN05880593_101233 [Rhizobium sp. RU36D]